MKKVYQYLPNGIYYNEYPSISSAAYEVSADESSIRKAIKRGRKSCNYFWSKDKKVNYWDLNVQEKSKMPKVLVFDIETAPLLASIWRLKTEYVAHSMLEGSANWWMISWSAKWLFEDEILNDVVYPGEALEEDDSRILKSIWDLINEADIVISHNGINFDHKMLNMRWLMNQMSPPSPYRVIDTMRSVRSLFSFPSYSLNYLSQQLGVGKKLEHEGFDMWRKSLIGDPEALDNMSRYNDVDIKILEDLYLIIRPWIRNHPNLGIFIESETPVCRVCGSTHLTELVGHDYTTNLSKYSTMRCECGAINKQRKSKLPLKTRKVLMSGMPQ